MKNLIIISLFLLSVKTYSQNYLYAPKGTSGIYSSSNNNVGIGTQTPGGNLEIYGASNPTFILKGASSRLEVGVSTCDGCFASYAKNMDVVYRVLGPRHGLIFHLPNDNADGNSYIKFGDEANGGWYSIYNNKTAIINGKVSIGSTKSPTEALEVCGTIRAKEIKLENTNWPDYVFSKDYALPSIEEVSNHIEEHKHLPGIPSAENVEKNGISLSEMNAKLLQKIEELMLYTIQQQEMINTLKEDVKVLKNKK